MSYQPEALRYDESPADGRQCNGIVSTATTSFDIPKRFIHAFLNLFEGGYPSSRFIIYAHLIEGLSEISVRWGPDGTIGIPVEIINIFSWIIFGLREVTQFQLKNQLNLIIIIRTCTKEEMNTKMGSNR
jgi:hypothetical protein